MVRCLRCFILQGATSLLIPLLVKVAVLPEWLAVCGEPSCTTKQIVWAVTHMVSSCFTKTSSWVFYLVGSETRDYLVLEIVVPPSQLYVALTNLRLTPYPLPSLVLIYLWHSLIPFASVCQGREWTVL